MSNTRAAAPPLDLESVEDLGKMEQGSFNFRTLEEVHRIATLLAAICPAPQEAEIGICELMINAIEHGNLGITNSEKHRLKQEDNWLQEIAVRLASRERGEHLAKISFQRCADRMVFCIEDEGQGFEWQHFLEIDPNREEHLNGRGIALARSISFDSVEYESPGNRVIATILLTGTAA